MMRNAGQRRLVSGRRGFVLLIVLALITACGLYAAGSARTSLAASLEAAARQRALQQHWARESLKSVVLLNAPRVLMPPGRARDVRTSLEHSVMIGGARYRLLLADEDVKVPLNTLDRLVDPETVAKIVSKLQGTRLQDRGRREGATGSWEHLLALTDVEREPSTIASRTRQITLWGSGRVNVNRCRPEVVMDLVGEVLGPQVAGQVGEILERGRIASVFDLAERLALNLEQRQKLGELVGTSSDSYSLWILPAGQTGGELYVAERLSQQQGEVVSFSW
jgi:hypothetical protein